MKFLSGIIIGLVLGSTLAASAASYRWYTGAEILLKSETFQQGYVAGVYDGFTHARDLVDYGAEHNTDVRTVLQILNHYAACFNRHSDSLGAFRNWAVLQWTSYSKADSFSAPSVLLSGECSN